MSAAAPIAALALAAVLAVAGVAKLADPKGSRTAVVAFGVPAGIARPLALLLPAAEIVSAGLLVAGAAGAGALRDVGAIAALALLTAFCAAIAANLLRGRAPDCHCFGQLHSEPVGRRTLARNGVLLALAAFVVSDGNPIWTVAAAAAVVPIVLLVGRRRDTPRASGLPFDGLAPGFTLPALGGGTISLEELLGAGRPLLLVFTDPDCGPCIALGPEVAAWQRKYAGELEVVAIERGEAPVSGSDPFGRRNIAFDSDREVARRYGAEGTPSALLIGAGGEPVSELAGGAPAIRELVARAVPGFEPGAEAIPARGAILRRELIARTAAAWVAIPGLAVPAWAAQQIELECRYQRCGNRCCPKKAKCRKRGNRKVCICKDGRPACGNRCCRETFVCRRRRGRRRCVCPDGHIVCAGRCVRPKTDPGHCGRCGERCPTGTSCVQGSCVGGDGTGTGPGGSGGCECPPGKACCEGDCTDLNNDNRHCGECGKACPAGQSCCEGRCRSLRDDPANCGRCGRRCESDEVCSEGECRRRCRNGLTNCNGSCVNTATDSRYCGGCSGCTGPFDTGECCNGDCCDINGSACCPGNGCTNLALDDENCGACGNVCPAGSFCRFGTCADGRRSSWIRRRSRAGARRRA